MAHDRWGDIADAVVDEMHCDWFERQELVTHRVAAALRAAFEEGRKSGIEDAAKVLDGDAKELRLRWREWMNKGRADIAHDREVEARDADYIAARIRALVKEDANG